MTTECLDSIKDVLDDMGIKSVWHSFLNIPSERVFATYYIPSMNFDGHDLRAEYYDYTVRVTLFFKPPYTANDETVESRFAEGVRQFGRFSRDSGFDSTNGLFYSTYTFEFKEFFEE